jgi:hypothetical protein
MKKVPLKTVAFSVIGRAHFYTLIPVGSAMNCFSWQAMSKKGVGF